MPQDRPCALTIRSQRGRGEQRRERIDADAVSRSRDDGCGPFGVADARHSDDHMQPGGRTQNLRAAGQLTRD